MLAIDIITGPGASAADPAPAGSAGGRLVGQAFQALLAMGDDATASQKKPKGRLTGEAPSATEPANPA